MPFLARRKSARHPIFANSDHQKRSFIFPELIPMNPTFLNYHHLRYFWEVARAGSLRAASEKIHVSQPTLSGQIKVLEESIGQKLFERSGRGLRLTNAGHLVMNHASDIFAAGGRLMEALAGRESDLPLKLNIGIADSLPKLVAWNLIRPVVQAFPKLQLSCVEASTNDLLGQLASLRLDLVLADEPAPTSMPIKSFSHLLGEASVMFCAEKKLATKLKRDFPKSLDGAPVLLPANRTAWRHQLDHWFAARRIRPRLVAEFDDAALMKTAAADGLGFAPIAMPVLQDAKLRYGLHPIGKPAGCGFACYMITLERAVRHPAVLKITSHAREIMRETPSRKAKA